MIRGVGLHSGIAINVITMIGIGPLITIPLVLAQLAGPLALIGWIAGAIVALCDGLVWAELSSQFPGSGGTYVYLREVFGRDRWGRFLAFLFNWQFLLFAPCLLASGYIGFAGYFSYLAPAVATSRSLQIAIAMAVGVAVIVMLYRRITVIAATSSAFAVVAVATLLIVMTAAFSHGTLAHAFGLPPHATFGLGFVAGLGGALYITLYDYLGYSDVALLGDEVRTPQRTIPGAIVLSILIVAVLYIALQVGVLAHGVPAGNPQFIASAIVANSWGTTAARVVTVLILITAFASVYGNLVGFARIPYAAAKDGEFFRPFAHLHPTGVFPDVALLVIGIAALAACFFDLGEVIAILTAGIVLIQGVMQIVALFVMRARGERAPYRMWLYPLPALGALVGWLYAFAYTGGLAIALGMGWLGLGVIAYLITARFQKRWPFALIFALASLTGAHAAATQDWPGSAVIQKDGYPIYTVGGKPFFLYGAAFFYERIPRSQWAASLQQYRAMGLNTIDLYVMWNWHEPRDGNFDFTGRTNARRDLQGLLRLIDRDGFKIVLRPGPVIRNEWRNGGYPDWLLTRPQYNMPLRDVLEGRYPAPATLQNKHSDDAAAEWLANATHIRYASRWLRNVLHAVAPWKRDIIAIALDDDQGAYLDNQTWPAPHFQRYINFLAATVRSVTGPRIPLFINTYDMKVTASAPVWAWGNWYQSDTYSIGSRDRAQLELSIGLIATQPGRPIMISEFQAGWLQGADEPQPRPADPSNTTLALNSFLQMGAHGVVNFPVQDTFNPAGWEAPWSNAFYSWDAALALQLTKQSRWLPTYRFGELIHTVGPLLAQTHIKADAAIAYLTSAYDPSVLNNDQIAKIAQATSDAQRGCHATRITCTLVDLRFDSLANLRRYPAIITPRIASFAFLPAVAKKLAAYRLGGGRVVQSAGDLHVGRPAAGGIPDAVLLVDPAERFGFLSVVNYSRYPVQLRATNVYAAHLRATFPKLTVAARDAALISLRVPANMYLRMKPLVQVGMPAFKGMRLPVRPGAFVTASSLRDTFQDGYGTTVLENTAARLVISPCAGARAFIFENKRNHVNYFTTIGGLRDAWTPQLAPSPRDYIAHYTHPIPTGTFNRCYRQIAPSSSRSVTLAYTAPDAPGGAARFSRTIALSHNDASFQVTTTARFARQNERAEQLTSFAVAPSARLLKTANCYGLFDPNLHTVAAASWRASDVTAHRMDLHAHDGLLTLTFVSGATSHVRYGVLNAPDISAAQAALQNFAKAR